MSLLSNPCRSNPRRSNPRRPALGVLDGHLWRLAGAENKLERSGKKIMDKKMHHACVIHPFSLP